LDKITFANFSFSLLKSCFLCFWVLSFFRKSSKMIFSPALISLCVVGALFGGIEFVA